MSKIENDIAAEVLKEVSAMTDRTLETRNRIIEATWRAIVKEDEVKPEDGVLQIQKHIRTAEGQEETRYSFIYKGEFAAGIIEKQQYCDYSYFLISDKISVSELMQKVTEVALEQEGRKDAEQEEEWEDPDKDTPWAYEQMEHAR